MSDQPKSNWLGLDFQLLKILWPYIYKSKIYFFTALALLLISDLLAAYVPMLIQKGVDVDIFKKDTAGLKQTLFYLILLLLSSLLTRVVATYTMAWVGQKILYALRLNLLDKVFRLPRAFFDRVSTGQVLTNITNDVESVRQFISEAFIGVLSSLGKLLFISIFMCALSPWLALVTLLTIPLYIGGTLWFKSSIREGFRAVRQANAEINTRMVESLNGHREIVLFQHREANEFMFDQSNRQYLKAYKNIVNAYAIYLPLVENITHVSTLVVLWMAHFTTGKVLQPGEIFAFFSLIHMFFRPLREMAEEFNTFQSAMSAMERVRSLLAEAEPIGPPLSSSKMSLPEGALGVDFEAVHFGYQANKPVLTGLSLSIGPSQTVALVGPTGAGKSTIIHLINRLYEVQQGEVRLGGVPLKSLELSILRGSVATIPQDVTLFSGSVRENIRLFDPSIPLYRVDEAVEGLGLGPFIKRLGQGLDTELGETGASLSEGEKQLIAFARAWVKGPRVLILDEATANVDSRTEQQLGEALKRLKQGRTTIVIAHRLSTIQAADKIFVLHLGQLAEAGSHDELLQQRGIYYKLYRRQSLSSQVEREVLTLSPSAG